MDNKPTKQADKKQVDLQDALLMFGFLSVAGGVALFSVALALIVMGLMSFGFVFLIEQSKQVRK